MFTTIDFMEEDLEGVTMPDHDPLVIMHVVGRGDRGRSRFTRVLVDIGAYVDVMYWDAFNNLQLTEGDLFKGALPIHGFRKNDILVVSLIKLPITLGKLHQEMTLDITFTMGILTFATTPS